jgi:copper homeostasis protein
MSEADGGVTVEICVQGIASALAAEAGGADRVELCEDLAVGGVTPSAGVIAVVCRRLAIPVHVLVRPRGGDFVYTDDEFAAMLHDIAAARAQGAAGIVAGPLSGDGTVDRSRCEQLVAAARPLGVTFHRAIDEARDPFEALEVLAELGFERVLTSGQAPSAAEGLERLVRMKTRARGRLAILAGGRIDEQTIPRLVGAGLDEIHIGSAACAGGVTRPEQVGRLVAIARSAGRGKSRGDRPE